MYARCPEGHCPEKVLTYLDDAELGIFLNADGSVTNIWEDGTVGVTPDQATQAVDQDDAYCPDHIGQEVRWIHD